MKNFTREFLILLSKKPFINKSIQFLFKILFLKNQQNESKF